MSDVYEFPESLEGVDVVVRGIFDSDGDFDFNEILVEGRDVLPIVDDQILDDLALIAKEKAEAEAAEAEVDSRLGL